MSQSKPKIAFFDFAGCEGCQLTVVDSLQMDVELLDSVEIVQFREAISDRGDQYQIAFVEGACTRPQDEGRLLEIREQAALVVALGACAHIGGINALKNWQSNDEIIRYVYKGMKKSDQSYQAKPIGAIIAVDAFIPGCPIDRQEFVRVVKALLQGRKPFIPDYPVCLECKLKENSCLVLDGEICLGPVIRAGCGALCPSLGVGCEGCRGLIPNPNLRWLDAALEEHGIGQAEIMLKKKLFLSHTMMESEV